MDKELVERITREVLSKYYSKEKILVIIMGADRNLEKALESVKKIAQKFKTKILLTKTAQQTIGVERVKTETGIEDVIIDDGKQDPVNLSSWPDVLAIPTLTLHGLTKIANLIPDSLHSNVVIGCLERNIPILVTKDTIWTKAYPEPQPSTSLFKKIEEYLTQLRNYGIKITTTERILEDIYEISPITASSQPAQKISSTTSTPTPIISTQHDLCSAFTKDTECEECGKCVERKKGSVEAIIQAGADRISAYNVKDIRKEIASIIDHTLLRPTATQEEIAKLCEEAKKYKFASVCVNPAYVGFAKELLKGTDVKVCTVVGFPLGATTTITKIIETKEAIANGADEIDMVLNIGALKSGNYNLVYEDIKAVREASRGKILKVILETAYLTNEEKIKACQLAKQAGADFVKTSTGFGPAGATVEDVRLMKETVGPMVGIKAAGGIRTLEQAKALVEAGATRIGASASVAIIGAGVVEEKY